jgi:hypothetical protein
MCDDFLCGLLSASFDKAITLLQSGHDNANASHHYKKNTLCISVTRTAKCVTSIEDVA